MRVWTVSEVKAGTLTQCLGVGRHFDPEPHSVIVEHKLRNWRKGLLSPYRPLEQPEPDLIISCGSMAPRHVFSIVSLCRRKPFTVHLRTPQKQFARKSVLAFIGRHDWNAEAESHPNYQQMIGAPHQITHQALTEMRGAARAKWVKQDTQAVTVLVGGPTQAFLFDEATIERLVNAIRGFADEGRTVLVSTSRRSHPDILRTLLAMDDERIIVWDRQGPNPYREFLAAADDLVVTEDSVTMACEAFTTGRPVHVFGLPGIPSAKYAKFQRFHKDLRNDLGLVRQFDGTLASYSYEVPDEARRIASLIRQQLDRRSSR